ncbi:MULTISPECIES: response regulator [Novosphingobium]|uniref:Two component transcriptional regulator, winged helix family n=1 Tax=Novosphingobium mathurense TaxID=428990 RepID=A0A1U6GZB6_9SPHN|nr:MULTISPECIES: response regulator [Novosphingobium]CDO36738.1 Two component transcriptional regulator, winged helix family [Novosphingobium sp. KN65.2]SLJ88892.1 two component transcriptional regulator, winged helix family [Novosphingobium mathurense]
MNPLALIAEDDKDIAEIIRAYLEREGFRTVQASDGRTALDIHLALKPDILLLDISMPLVDGWGVLSEVRRRGNTPVVVITALDQDIDKLQALRIGADDYVVKPFNPVEVVARVKAVLRRSGDYGANGVLRVGPVEIDTNAHLVRTERGEVALTLTEFRLLTHMARTPTRVFSRGELLDACMPGSDALDRTVDSHVSKLRRKLDQAGVPEMPEGVRGVGYRLWSRG